MNHSSIIGLSLICCLGCAPPKTESLNLTDSLVSIPLDTTSTSDKNQTAILPSNNEPALQTEVGDIIIEKGERIYLSTNQFSFISYPYDFNLDAGTIEGLLGEGTETKVEEFEGGEDYGPYTYTSIEFGNTSISFYDYPGKHFSTITTSLLPLKNGIVIGMKKADFLEAMGFFDTDAPTVNSFRLTDDYGQMEFLFVADTLKNIYAHYEEGD